MERKRETAAGLIGLLFYLGIVVVVMLIIIRIEKPEPIPGGIAMDFGNSEDGDGEIAVTVQAMAGGKNNTNFLTSMNSDETVRSTDQTSPNNSNSNTNTNNNDNSKPSLLQQMLNGSKSQGQTGKTGDQGKEDGIPNGGKGGEGDCKGCIGSGTALGKGDATNYRQPTMNDPQDATVKLKIEINPEGEVISVILVDGGAASFSAREICKKAAKELKFPANTSITTNRVGYITYNLTKG